MDKDFWVLITKDPVALYAAALSTFIAIVAAIRAFYKWWTAGPKAWVEIINPLEVALSSQVRAEIIIANTGAIPFVAKEICVTVHKSRHSDAIHTSKFNHGTLYDPSTKTIPDPFGKPNTSKRIPHVIRPGEEAHHYIKPSPPYDPSKDWLRVQVTLRSGKKPTTGWAAPIDQTP